jgi:hypothetical protein
MGKWGNERMGEWGSDYLIATLIPPVPLSYELTRIVLSLLRFFVLDSKSNH